MIFMNKKSKKKTNVERKKRKRRGEIVGEMGRGFNILENKFQFLHV